MSDNVAEAKESPVRRPLDVECSMDIGVPATFYCSRCKKPFCEDCLWSEAGSKTLCIHCASVEEAIEDEARGSLGSAIVKQKKLVLGLITVVLTGIIAFNAYTLYNNHLESDQTKVFRHEMSPQLMGIAKCRANLEALVKEAVSYHQMVNRPPSSLEELATILATEFETKDPVSLAPYIIESDGTGNITAHCPTPEAHGVSDIIAEPGKPARLIYKGGRP